MDLRVIGVLLLIPLLDILLLFVVGGIIGPVPTVALVVLTALIGMLLVRAEGRATLRGIQTKFARGELPEDELVDGALLIAAGALFLTPGLVTDLVALLIALPPTRYPIRLLAKRFVVTPYIDARTGGFGSGSVYIGGFPTGGDGGAGPGTVAGPGTEDAMDVEVEDVRDRSDDSRAAGED